MWVVFHIFPRKHTLIFPILQPQYCYLQYSFQVRKLQSIGQWYATQGPLYRNVSWTPFVIKKGKELNRLVPSASSLVIYLKPDTIAVEGRGLRRLEGANVSILRVFLRVIKCNGFQLVYIDRKLWSKFECYAWVWYVCLMKFLINLLNLKPLLIGIM